MNIYNLLDFKKKEKLEIKNEGNRKANFIFQNFEDQKEWKNKGKKFFFFRTNIIKEKKILLKFKKQKKSKNRAKNPKDLLILKERKKGKQSNEKE